MNVAPMQQPPAGQGMALNTQYSTDLTTRNFDSHMGPVTATGGLMVKFFYVKVKCSTRDASHNGQVQTRLCVAKQPKGDRRTVAVRFITEDQARREFPREFDLFERFEDVPDQGTPLSELPGISVSDIAMMQVNGLRSIEDMVSITEDQAAQIGLDATRIRKVAETWLSRREDSSDILDSSEAAARLEVENKSLKERLQKMEAQMQRIEMQNEALQSVSGGQKKQQPSAAPVNGQVDAQAIEVDDDLPYNIEEMDSWGDDGPVEASGNEDLGGSGDIDPLANG